MPSPSFNPKNNSYKRQGLATQRAELITLVISQLTLRPEVTYTLAD